MSLDLNKLENKLDEALSNETSETLNKFLNDKRMTNNKQQTAMTLYTEEQVRSIIQKARSNEDNWYSDNYLLAEQTPIELPSDEDIKKIMELDGMEFDEFDPYDASYLGGACWMRNKIQGDNK